MTDPLSGKEDAQRILAYADVLAKESRKALIAEFNQKHKGVPFKTASQLLRDSFLAWFARREKSLKFSAESTDSAALGEVRATFRGDAKKVSFKLQVYAKFTLAGGLADSPCYLKDLNVTVAG